MIHFICKSGCLASANGFQEGYYENTLFLYNSPASDSQTSIALCPHLSAIKADNGGFYVRLEDVVWLSKSPDSYSQTNQGGPLVPYKEEHNEVPVPK